MSEDGMATNPRAEVGDEEELDEHLDEDPERSSFVAIKWIAEGAATLAEVAVMLRAHAAGLEDEAAKGWELTRPIDNGYGEIVRSAEMAARFPTNPDRAAT